MGVHSESLLASAADNRVKLPTCLICLASTLPRFPSITRTFHRIKKLKLQFLLCSNFRARNSINSFYWSLETVVGYHVERSSFLAYTIVYRGRLNGWERKGVSEWVIQSITLGPIRMKNEPGDGIVIKFICTSNFSHTTWCNHALWCWRKSFSFCSLSPRCRFLIID